MATRQYIGARYVIKVYENSLDPNSAEWENVAFEPLTMVTYQNSSYISKKQVPANVGNPVTATTYWVCTGYYNGQISALQTDVANIGSQITALTNQSAILNKPTNSARFLLMGDSYGPTSGWPSAFTNLLSGSASAVNYTMGGRTFVGTMSYLAYLTDYVNAHTQDELNAFNYLILLGGIGDSHPESNSQLQAKIEEFIDYAHVHLPNAKIYLGYIGGGLSGYGGEGDPGSATSPRRLNAAYKYHNAANNKKEFYIAGINNVVNNYRWYTGADMDGLHPQSGTGIGYWLAHYLFNFINTGSADYIISEDHAINIGDSTGVTIICEQMNDVTDVRIGPFTLTLGNDIGANGNQKYKIMTLPDYVPIYNSDKMNIALVAYDANGAELVPLTLIIQKHELYITSYQRKTAGSWWQVASGKKIDIPLTRFILPTALIL